MPPRPKSPAMRYRPATTVPGRKRPSSTLMVVLRWGTLEAPVPRTTVSAELASSGAAQDEQKRLFWAHSREQAGHRTMRSILARRGHLGFEAPVGAPGGIPLRQRQRYANARLIFSIASSISAVFLKPTVTLSTPALRKANRIAACRSSRFVNLPSPTSLDRKSTRLNSSHLGISY